MFSRVEIYNEKEYIYLHKSRHADRLENWPCKGEGERKKKRENVIFISSQLIVGDCRSRANASEQKIVL